MLAALGFLAGSALADHRDDVRGLLYRVDAQALTLRLHPSEPIIEARAIERQANDAAQQLDDYGLRFEARALRREAQALIEAAQSAEPEDVRLHAIRLQRLIREVDDALPAPEISR
jgi:hypothetical protein